MSFNLNSAALILMVYDRLVQSFERIIDALLSHRDFTSVKISESGITLLAERVNLIP